MHPLIEHHRAENLALAERHCIRNLAQARLEEHHVVRAKPEPAQ